MKRRLAMAAAGIIGLSGCGSGGPPPVLVLAASSTTDVMEEISAAAADGEPGLVVDLVVAGSPSLIAQLESGVDADLLITADRATMDRAIAGGRITGPPIVIAANALVLAVADGNPAAITSLSDLADPSLTIGSCAPEVPCGALASAAAAAAGVTIRADSEELSVRSLAAKILLGEIDAGLIYNTDAVALGLTTVTVPRLDLHTNQYYLALIGDPPSFDARTLASLITGPEGQSIFVAAGFEPA